MIKMIHLVLRVKRITTNSTNPCFILAFRHFEVLMMKKLSYKYYNKRITTRDNGNVQSHDKEESKLNSTITANSGAHTLTHDQIIKKSIQ